MWRSWGRVLSKLVLDFQMPDRYDKQTITTLIRAICNQVNTLSEGKIQANYQATTVVPGSSVAAQVGDKVWDSNTTVRSGTIAGAVGNYVRLGWVCTVADPVNPTWQEMRVGIG